MGGSGLRGLVLKRGLKCCLGVWGLGSRGIGKNVGAFKGCEGASFVQGQFKDVFRYSKFCFLG